MQPFARTRPPARLVNQLYTAASNPTPCDRDSQTAVYTAAYDTTRFFIVSLLHLMRSMVLAKQIALSLDYRIAFHINHQPLVTLLFLLLESHLGGDPSLRNELQLSSFPGAIMSKRKPLDASPRPRFLRRASQRWVLPSIQRAY